MCEVNVERSEYVTTEEFAAASGAMKDVLLGLGLEWNVGLDRYWFPESENIMEYQEGREEMQKCARIIAEEAKMIEMMLAPRRAFGHELNHTVVSSCVAAIKGCVNIIDTQIQVRESGGQ